MTPATRGRAAIASRVWRRELLDLELLEHRVGDPARHLLLHRRVLRQRRHHGEVPRLVEQRGPRPVGQRRQRCQQGRDEQQHDRPRPAAASGATRPAPAGGATACDRAAVAATCARSRSSSARSSLVRSPVAPHGSTGSSVVSPARGSGTGVASGLGQSPRPRARATRRLRRWRPPSARTRARWRGGGSASGWARWACCSWSSSSRWSGAAPGRRRSGRPTAGTASVPTVGTVRGDGSSPSAGDRGGQPSGRSPRGTHSQKRVRSSSVGRVRPQHARRAAAGGRATAGRMPVPARLATTQRRRVGAGARRSAAPGAGAAANRGSEESRPGRAGPARVGRVHGDPGCRAPPAGEHRQQLDLAALAARVGHRTGVLAVLEVRVVDRAAPGCTCRPRSRTRPARRRPTAPAAAARSSAPARARAAPSSSRGPGPTSCASAAGRRRCARGRAAAARTRGSAVQNARTESRSDTSQTQTRAAPARPHGGLDLGGHPAATAGVAHHEVHGGAERREVEGGAPAQAGRRPRHRDVPAGQHAGARVVGPGRQATAHGIPDPGEAGHDGAVERRSRAPGRRRRRGPLTSGPASRRWRRAGSARRARARRR